jgi:hypothetical protein
MYGQEKFVFVFLFEMNLQDICMWKGMIQKREIQESEAIWIQDDFYW